MIADGRITVGTNAGNKNMNTNILSVGTMYVGSRGGELTRPPTPSPTPSDSNIKRNMKRLTSTTQKISRLHGVYFNWKVSFNNSTKRKVGVIAQDVQEEYPIIV